MIVLVVVNTEILKLIMRWYCNHIGVNETSYAIFALIVVNLSINKTILLSILINMFAIT